MASRRTFMVWTLLAALVIPAHGGVSAQATLYTSALLPSVRRAAMLVPGDLPTAIRVVSLNPFKGALSSMVEGSAGDSVPVAYPVFQIRFPRGWIVVDAALDRAFVPNSKSFSDVDYEQIHLALRDAHLVVVTHEHHDHVAGVLRSPYLSQVQQHTLLTRSQIRTLLEKPNNPRVKIDSAMAERYLSIEYDPFLPIAPGVVLIRALGHTPGSQMVFVRLASGREVILAGDIAWHMSGIATLHQKPEVTSRSLGEDRDALASQLAWLRDVTATETLVVVSHDGNWIAELIKRGVLVAAFDLTNP